MIDFIDASDKIMLVGVPRCPQCPQVFVLSRVSPCLSLLSCGASEARVTRGHRVLEGRAGVACELWSGAVLNSGQMRSTDYSGIWWGHRVTWHNRLEMQLLRRTHIILKLTKTSFSFESVRINIPIGCIFLSNYRCSVSELEKLFVKPEVSVWRAFSLSDTCQHVDLMLSQIWSKWYLIFSKKNTNVYFTGTRIYNKGLVCITWFLGTLL